MYQVPILYCKTYYNVNSIILSLESDSADGLEDCLEKSSLSIEEGSGSQGMAFR